MPRLFTIFGIVVLVTVAAPPQAIAGSSQRLFELPGHGLVGLEAMGYWENEVHYQEPDEPPEISFQHDGGMFTADGSERIRITVTPAWRTPDAAPDFGTEVGVRRMVQQYADEMQEFLDTDNLKVMPVGGERIGFWFIASDRDFFSSSLEDDFRHVRRGAIVAGKLVLTFTILTDDEPSSEGSFAIQLMSHSEHLPGTCANVSTSCYSYANNLRGSADPR